MFDINKNCLYNTDIFLKEGRMEPEKLDKLIYSLVGNQQEIFEKRNETPLEVEDKKKVTIINDLPMRKSQTK